VCTLWPIRWRRSWWTQWVIACVVVDYLWISSSCVAQLAYPLPVIFVLKRKRSSLIRRQKYRHHHR
jgi:hypothetical protein